MIFFFCYFGESINSQFDELNDVIYQSDWYTHQLDIQRIIPTILIATQHPPVLKGFGNLVCTRESFKKVDLLYIKFKCYDLKWNLHGNIFDSFSGGQ